MDLYCGYTLLSITLNIDVFPLSRSFFSSTSVSLARLTYRIYVVYTTSWLTGTVQDEAAEEDAHFLDQAEDVTEDTWRRPPLERPIDPDAEALSA